MVILIDSNEAAVLTGFHRIHIWNLMKKGDFPAPIFIKLNQKRPGRPKIHFRKDQVESWVAARTAKKNSKRLAQSGVTQ